MSQAKEAIKKLERYVARGRYAGRINEVKEVIALLRAEEPKCKTCGGSGIKWVGHGHKRHRIYCPDCKPEEPEASDDFVISIPNLRPNEIPFVRSEIRIFTKQLLNQIEEHRQQEKQDAEKTNG